MARASSSTWSSRSTPSLLTSFADVRLRGTMGDPTGVDRYQELSTEPLDKWKRTLGNPVAEALVPGLPRVDRTPSASR